MKSIFQRFLMLCGCFLLLKSALSYVHSLVFDRERIVRKEFGSDAAIQDIGRLYAKISSGDFDQDLVRLEHCWKSYVSARRVPKHLLPERFNRWGISMEDEQFKRPHYEPHDVLAYYDEANKLVGLEFATSRHGCFITSDPSRCPPGFNRLYRLSDRSPYVMAWVGQDD